MINAQTKPCLIIGDPVKHSLSPVMHNTAYQKLGIDNQFAFLAAKVKPVDLRSAVKAVRALNIRGLTCTIPHKTAVIPLLDRLDPLAKKIGAVNTVVNQHGLLTGYNTDCFGALTALEKVVKLTKQKVAVIGAGGAAKAIVFGLVSKKLKVTVFNRTFKKAQTLAKKTNCQAQLLTNLSLIKNMDIIINTTSVGMVPDHKRSLVPKNLIQPHHLVMDIVYSPLKTQLLKNALSKKAKIIHGLDMLLYQATAQFELYTNHKAPVSVMRQALIKHLKFSI